MNDKKLASHKKIKILWITDPWETLDHSRDTTLRLMRESLLSNRVTSYWCDSRTVEYQNKKIQLKAIKIKNEKHLSSSLFLKQNPKTFFPQFFDQIHYRKDPPQDDLYLNPLKLLMSVCEKKIINPPLAILKTTEKLAGLFSTLPNPPSLVTCDEKKILNFLKTHTSIVLKPLIGAQSKGVRLIHQQTLKSIKKILKVSTSNGKQHILIQKQILKAQTHGEVRVWICGGKVIGIALKKPKKSIFILEQGSTIHPYRASTQEKKLFKKTAHILANQNIQLAAIDFADGKILDWNITSPGLLMEMEKALQKNLAHQIIEHLTKLKIK